MKPEDGVRAPEGVKTHVSVMSFPKNSDRSISYYLIHLRGQTVCNTPILREKTVGPRKERSKVRRGSQQENKPELWGALE